MQQALPLAAQQQFLAQQSAAYAAQQAAPYVINPGQEGPYVGLIPGYGYMPWGMYPANLIPQQGAQPRRPLTPSQQAAAAVQAGADQQPYLIFHDQNGSLMMGPRTGTPMRLVSPAPVLVPPGARAPQAPPAIYPPQPNQQNQMYHQSQNGTNCSAGKSPL